MKIQPTHIDLVDSIEQKPLTFAERLEVQMEMIRDHQYLTHANSMEDAVLSWVSQGWAARFNEHYPTISSSISG